MRAMHRISYLHWLVIFVLLAALDFAWLQGGVAIDQVAGDLFLKLHARQRPPSRDVVVVDIDQKSLEEMIKLAGNWPWPRSVHGELIEALEKQRPRAIVFDVMFSERDLFRDEMDVYLANAIKAQHNVYLAMAVTSQGIGSYLNSQLPATLGVQRGPTADPKARTPVIVPIFNPALWRGGMINFLPDSDQVGRHYYVYVEDQGWRFPSLPASVATDLQWPLPAQDRIMLNWRQAPPHVSYSDIYLDAQREHPLRAPDEFTGKVVVVGAAAPGLSDLRATPLDKIYPGVNILATAIDNLRAGDWLREAPRFAVLPWLLLLFAGIAWAFQRGLSALVVAGWLLAGSVLTLALAWAALTQGWWLPVYSAIAWSWCYYLLCAFVAYLAERERREAAISMFKRFLDPRVVSDLVSRGEIDNTANAQSRDVTVLFSDIRGFTTLSETSTPEAIVSLLNRYFSTQVEIVFRHGGTLDKFIGDAIMAFWGAPVADPDHAKHAVAAAIEMGEALERFKAELADQYVNFDIGIGLNSGPAVVAFIGSTDRLDYTAIGDTVNLASRIEGETKGVARVLVSETTRLAAGEGFAYRYCGERHVKGREQGVKLYEPKRLQS